MTTPCHFGGGYGPIKLAKHSYFLLKCIYLARMVSGRVFVCEGYRFCLFLRFWKFILEYDIFFISFLILLLHFSINNLTYTSLAAVTNAFLMLEKFPGDWASSAYQYHQLTSERNLPGIYNVVTLLLPHMYSGRYTWYLTIIW